MIYENELLDIKLPKKVYAQIETAVTNLFVELGIGEYPIDPVDIIRRKGYILRTYSDLSPQKRHALRVKELDATSFYAPNLKTFVIYYDETQSLERIRFTLMHEVGHITMGHKEESDLAKKMADYFAAYALAPSPIIMQFHCEDYIDVAHIFVISTLCADYSFQRYRNWVDFSGHLKSYECELIALFKSKNKNEERSDVG